MEYISKEYKQLIRIIQDEYKCSYTEVVTKYIPQIKNNLELYNQLLIK